MSPRNNSNRYQGNGWGAGEDPTIGDRIVSEIYSIGREIKELSEDYQESVETTGSFLEDGESHDEIYDPNQWSDSSTTRLVGSDD